MDAVSLSSSTAATPIQFVLLLLPGNLMLEDWLSWGEKKRVREFDNVFEGAILAFSTTMSVSVVIISSSGQERRCLIA